MKLAAVPAVQPRAVMYGRVSAVMGRGDDLTSPELQEFVVREYCARRGYQSAVWLCDVDKTGRSWSTRQVEQAVKMIESGQADVIVVPRWSRFTRNLRDYVIHVARVEAAGGRVESALEETDPATAAGLLQRDLFAVLAQWESRVKGEQWKETHQRRNRAGLPHQNRPRLGYELVDGKYRPDPVEAPIVVELYDRYIAGSAVRPLVRWVHQEGLRSKADPTVPWTHRGLMYSLESGFPAGLLHVADGYLPGVHEPIISRETFDAFMQARRTRVSLPPRLVTPSTVLSGLLRCGACGRTMGCKTASAKHIPRYHYACGWPLCDKRSYVRRVVAEAFVQQWLRTLVGEASIRSAAEAVRSADHAVKKIDRERLLDKLADVESGIDTVEEMFVTRQYTAERRSRLLERLEHQKTDLLRQLEKSAVQPLPQLPDPLVMESMLARWDEMPAELNEWLRTLIREIRVVPTGHRQPPELLVTAVWDE